MIHSRRFITIALALIASTAASAAWATPIGDKYAALGGVGGFLGQPTIPESVTPDGVGHYRHYEGGSIYWHPRTGAQEVHGPIKQRWAELNWEKGYLGYPITDEINTVDGGGRVSRFEGGELILREKDDTVREVKASDLVVELPFPEGETWYVVQSHGGAGGSHGGQFSYCWDFSRGSQSEGKHFTAVANGRIVLADDSFPSGEGNGNIGNVVVQRLGSSRYASYLHNKTGSYSAHFGAGSLFLPQAIPWSSRPFASTGAVLATVGDTGTGVGNSHLHFCVTTAPDRAEIQPDGSSYKPFESVPVSFRNYEVSTTGSSWTDVAQGVPLAGKFLRRKGTQSAAAITTSAAPNGFGVVTAAVKLVGPGQPTSTGILTVTVMSKWGEPLKTASRPIGNITAGPWLATITGVPAYLATGGLKVVVSYSGAWSIPTSGGPIGGQSSAFSLAADTSRIVPVNLTVGQVPN